MSSTAQAGATQASTAQASGRPLLALGEFDSPAACLKAARAVREAGYRKFDTHTPFPVHGMDAAMGMRDSKLGWVVLIAAFTGLFSAVAMMVWMNGIDYALVIGGKPPISIPSMVPIGFELTILFSAFGAFIGMLHLNRLPQHHHPVFYSSRFENFSNDKFFVSIEAEDPKFHADEAKRFLASLGSSHVEIVTEPAQ